MTRDVGSVSRPSSSPYPPFLSQRVGSKNSKNVGIMNYRSVYRYVSVGRTAGNAYLRPLRRAWSPRWGQRRKETSRGNEDQKEIDYRIGKKERETRNQVSSRLQVRLKGWRNRCRAAYSRLSFSSSWKMGRKKMGQRGRIRGKRWDRLAYTCVCVYTYIYKYIYIYICM